MEFSPGSLGGKVSNLTSTTDFSNWVGEKKHQLALKYRSPFLGSRHTKKIPGVYRSIDLKKPSVEKAGCQDATPSPYVRAQHGEELSPRRLRIRIKNSGEGSLCWDDENEESARMVRYG